MSNIPKKILNTYSSIYIPKKREHYERNDKSFVQFTMSLIAWFILGFAVYLSFKCSNKFDLMQFIIAILFSPFYIIYHLAVTDLCGLMKK